jgi:hypothetical protein
MAEGHDDGSIAPRRSLSGPILPPPPPELTSDGRQPEGKAKGQRARSDRPAREAGRRPGSQDPRRQEAGTERDAGSQATDSPASTAAATGPGLVRDRGRALRSLWTAKGPGRPKQGATKSAPKQGAARPAAPRRNRRAQLRLVQVDAWSVMKTSFLLSIALGIVLVVAVAIIWSVLGAAGVWESINSIVQQAVGSDNSKPFNIQDYVGTSRILGFAMIVAVLDVILITAIATLGAFLYNLSAALLGGIEVTLAEDS